MRVLVTGGAGFPGQPSLRPAARRGPRGRRDGQPADRQPAQHRAPRAPRSGSASSATTSRSSSTSTARSTPCSTSPPRPPRSTTWSCRSRRSKSARSARTTRSASRHGQGGALPAGLDLRGLRRPARPSRSRRPTGATSTRSARAASTTRPSASREAITMAYQRAHGVDTRIVRIFNTYGERMRPRDGRVVPALIGQALAGEPMTVFGDGSQTRSFCYVSDLVDGIYRLLLSDENRAGQHRQPGGALRARFRADDPEADRDPKSRSSSSPCPWTTPRSASRTSEGAARSSAGSRR